MAGPTGSAAVSGPGKMSKRTDGGPEQKLRELPDAQYGEAQTFRDLQQGAPLAQTPTPGAASGVRAQPAAPTVPFGAPSQRPDEPVTAGNPLGPGPGPTGGGMAGGDQPDMSNLVALLPMLTQVANGPNGTPALRSLVRYLKGRQ